MSEIRQLTVLLTGTREALKQITSKLFEEIAPGVTIEAFAIGDAIDPKASRATPVRS